MWRAALLTAFALAADATTIIGDMAGFGRTVAEISIPAEMPDGYEAFASDNHNVLWTFTVTGGQGTGYLLFSAHVIGADKIGSPTEYIRSGARIDSPFSLTLSSHGGANAPNSCSIYDCGPVQFEYGVPVYIQAHASASVRYSYYPGPDGDIPAMFAGETIRSETLIELGGVYEIADGYWVQNESAEVNVAHNPEPGTWAMLAGALSMLLVHRRLHGTIRTARRG